MNANAGSRSTSLTPLHSHSDNRGGEEEEGTSPSRSRSTGRPSDDSASEYFDADLFTRDLRRFRTNYFCRQSCSNLCVSRRRRAPSGKAVYLVLLLCFLERVAYYGSLGNILPLFLSSTLQLPDPVSALVMAVVKEVVTPALYPLGGFLADVWIGRHKAIEASLWMLLFGYSLLSFLYSFGSLHHFDVSGTNPGNYALYLLPICFILISIGSTCFQANVIPFGADQITNNKSSEELSSYFFWYYGVRNAGAFVIFLSFVCKDITWEYITATAFASAACMCVALLLDVCLRDWLFIDGERRNPIKMVIKVLAFSATVKRPSRVSAFGYDGRLPPSRMDLAKTKHGGKFSREDVEEVKTFLYLLPVLVAVSSAFVVYTGVNSVKPLQLGHMRSTINVDFTVSSSVSCKASLMWTWGVNVAIIVFLVVLSDQLLCPFLRDYAPSMLRRMWFGLLLLNLAPLGLTVLEHFAHHQGSALNHTHTFQDLCMFNGSLTDLGLHLPTNQAYCIPMFLVVDVAEFFIVIAALEFFYAQSPHNARGLMIGLVFFVRSLFSSLAAFLIFGFSQRDDITASMGSKSGEACGFWYYLVLTVLGVIGFAAYSIVAWCYKPRQRLGLEDSGQYYVVAN